MSKCKFSTKVVGFFYGEIEDGKKPFIEKHIAHCKECRNWLDSADLISSNYKRNDLPFNGHISLEKERIPAKPNFLRFPAVVTFIFLLFLTVGIFQKANDIVAHFRLYNNLGVISCLNEITPLIADMEDQQQDN